jgi:endogenous inhibitor of DNA gyrase (YacG/DUF329 family)
MNNQNLDNQEPTTLNCPTCKKIVLWNDSFPYRPFCSDRCRLIDLGEWASESHRIAGDQLKADKDYDEYDDN